MAAFDNPVRATFAGLEALHVGYRGGSGYMAGWSNLNAASTPGTASGMRRLVGAEILPFTLPNANMKPVLGDDTVIDTFEFGATDVLRALIELGVNDDAFNIAAEGISKKTVGIYDFYGRGDSVGPAPTLMLLANSHAHGKDSGNLDEAGWRNELFLATRVKPLGSETIRHQEVGKARYDTVFNNSNVAFWGEVLSTAMSISYRRSIYWYSKYIGMIDVFIGDGETTAIPLTYAPVNDDATKVKAWNVTAGTLLTVSSASTSGKTATVSSAPAEANIVQVVYQTASLDA